jgi:hypothetical protein
VRGRQGLLRTTALDGQLKVRVSSVNCVVDDWILEAPGERGSLFM